MKVILFAVCILCITISAILAFKVESYHQSATRSHERSLSYPLRTSTLMRIKSLSMSTSAIRPAADTRRAKIPLNIAVAGGGIGGIFVANAMKIRGFNVTVFEKSAKFSRFGGPIQLASNALSCLNALSPELFDKVMERFTFTGTRKCGIKDGIRNQWYSVFDAITNLAEWNNLPYTGVIDRPDLQEILVDNLPEGAVMNSKPIVGYTEHEDGKVDIHTDTGETIKGFDVLIGADGIWSSIRAQMWGESSSRPGTCTYSGYTLFAAETVINPNSTFFKSEGYFDAGYKVYIGPGKYFVTSDVGAARIQWYAFLALPPGTKARASNVEYLKDQFEGWSEEIHACLDNTPEAIVEQRDLYDRRPSVLKSWSKGHVTMLGDAVHPMMPNLGQGGCQAIEDGFVLSGLLAEIDDRSQIEGALQEYYRQRIVRSAIVQGMSRLSSDIIISAFSTPFKLSEFLQDGLKYKYFNFPSIMTWNLKTFLPAIFYAQFGYLYSFAPSSFTQDFIKGLVSKIQTRHKSESKNVYNLIQEGYTTFFSAKKMAFMQFNRDTKEISQICDAYELRKQT